MIPTPPLCVGFFYYVCKVIILSNNKLFFCHNTRSLVTTRRLGQELLPPLPRVVAFIDALSGFQLIT